MQIKRLVNILRAHPHPLKLVGARLLQKIGLSHLFVIQMDGYKLRFYPTNCSANLWINPNSRVHGLEMFRDFCHEGDTVVDVGGNIGETAIIMSRRVGSNGKVFVFEPHPRIYTFLSGNIKLNNCSNVVARNLALGAKIGAVRFSDHKHDDMNRVDASGVIEVRCSTLDKEMPAGANIAFLKIDVEGLELFVLKGGQELLKRTLCVNCEMGEDHCRRYGYSMKDLIRFCAQQGFHTFVVDEGRKLRHINNDFDKAGGHELVAIRDIDFFLNRSGWGLA